jgi:hypothetical protein
LKEHNTALFPVLPRNNAIDGIGAGIAASVSTTVNAAAIAICRMCFKFQHEHGMVRVSKRTKSALFNQK